METILSFITISSDLDELFDTRKSTLSIIDALNIDKFNLIYVISKTLLTKNKKKIDSLKNAKNTYICLDNNEGIYKALNIGISRSLELNSTHICFINGGDKLEKGFIRSFQICIRNPKAIIGGNNRIVYKEFGRKNTIYKGGRAIWSINHQGSIYPAKLFKKNKYLSFMKVSADWHFNYDLRNKCKFIKHKSIVACFDYSNGISQSSNIFQLLLWDEIKVIKKYFFKPQYFFSMDYLFRIMLMLVNLLKKRPWNLY